MPSMTAVADLARDLRHAGRALRRRPGFTIVAVSTLAIGIGASTAMFSVVNSVLLRPLAYAEPDRLVAVAELPPKATEPGQASPRTLTAWRAQSTALAAITAFMDRPLTISDASGGDQAEVQARVATVDHFGVLGARARLGRTLLPGDEQEQVAVLDHALWQGRFGGDPDVVGRTIALDGVQHTVVGVMPASFHPTGGSPELWVPHPLARPDWPGRSLQAIGRLRPGATVAGARAEMQAITARLNAAYPDSHRDWGVLVTPLQEDVVGRARPALLVLLGAVSLLLLIACANVASLFLGRAVSRRKETAVRRSLGASRGRLVVQTMTEALVVALLAGAVGVALAHFGTGTILRLLPPELALPRLEEVAVDWRALAFALGVSVLTGALFGTAPAIGGSAVEPGRALRDVTRGATGARSPLRAALVVGEVALAVVMLASAGLLVRTVHNLLQVDTGLHADGVLTMNVALPRERYAEADARRRLFSELLARLDALPGTVATGTTSALPLASGRSANWFVRDDRPRPAPGQELVADYRVVGGDYFAAMGMRVLAGRVFDAADDADAPTRFVVNEALAQRHFPGEDPVGKRITYEWFGEQSGEIVGVVASVRETALDAEPSAAVYRAHAQDPAPRATIVVRTAGAPAALSRAAAAAVTAVDPTLPAPRVQSFEQVVTATLARQRLSMFLLVAFAGLALALVLIGLYGVVSYAVAQRRREFGVRVALGALPRDVVRMVLRDGLVLVGAGLAIGLAGTLAVGRVISGFLFGIAPFDPITLAAVVVLLLGTTMAASAVPARRATRVDPAGVLGTES